MYLPLQLFSLYFQFLTIFIPPILYQSTLKLINTVAGNDLLGVIHYDWYFTTVTAKFHLVLMAKTQSAIAVQKEVSQCTHNSSGVHCVGSSCGAFTQGHIRVTFPTVGSE